VRKACRKYRAIKVSEMIVVGRFQKDPFGVWPDVLRPGRAAHGRPPAPDAGLQLGTPPLQNRQRTSAIGLVNDGHREQRRGRTVHCQLNIVFVYSARNSICFDVMRSRHSARLQGHFQASEWR